MARYEQLTWRGSPGGRTRRDRSDCTFRAYVPDPLMGRLLDLPADVAADLGDADRAIAALQDQKVGLANIEAIARLLLRAEAVGSSFIEGLQINARRLAKEQYAEQAGLPTSDDTARAVLGNIRAMGDALALADPDRPITIEDLCDLHRNLLAGTRDEQWGGVVRQEQNWIGGVNPCRAAYVPPPPERVPELLDDLCAYLSSEDHPPVLQAAVAHAQFETIHPFVDGNGRVGRALIHLVLRRRGLAPNFVPPVSLILATAAGHYIAGLVAYRHEGGPNGPAATSAVLQWIDVFVSALLRACLDATSFAEELAAIEAKWRAAVKPRGSSATDLLLSALPGIPVLTVATAAQAIGRTPERTNDAVRKLEQAGVLRQGTVGRRNRVFEVNDLLDAITALERKLASPLADTEVSQPARIVPARRGRPGS